MAYFNELPDVEVISRFLNTENNEEYVKIKNLWRRAKVREDIASIASAFDYYQIQDNERPDQIAEKFYEDPELDWVILIANNITNINTDWPLDNNSLYNYLIDKYGSEEVLQQTHHVETLEQRDNFDRIIIPEKLIVDKEEFSPLGFTTSLIETKIQSYPAQDDLVEVAVSLVQAIPITQNDIGEELYPITDIREEEDSSFLKVYSRESGIVDNVVVNDIENSWSGGWGGSIDVYSRDGEINTIEILDKLNNELNITDTVVISNRLYEVVSEISDGVVFPVFRFRYLTEE